jgi:hypothetical protein
MILRSLANAFYLGKILIKDKAFGRQYEVSRSGSLAMTRLIELFLEQMVFIEKHAITA